MEDGDTPWRPPDGEGPPGGEVEEAEVQAALELARVVAVALALNGVLCAANVAQSVLFVSQHRFGVLAGEVGFAIQAVAFVYAGLRVYDGSSRSTLAGAAVGVGGALSAATWTAFLLLGGAFSLLAPVLALSSALCAALCLLLLRRVVRIERARAMD